MMSAAPAGSMCPNGPHRSDPSVGRNPAGRFTSRTKLTASKPEELIVNGTLLTDTLGREIDGADDGQAGSDYIATVSGNRLTTGEIV